MKTDEVEGRGDGEGKVGVGGMKRKEVRIRGRKE